MSSRTVFLFLLLLLVSVPVGAEAASPQPLHDFLEKHCFNCHGLEKPKGGLNLESLSRTDSMVRDLKAWENVVQQVSQREMPPKNKPQPGDQDREQFVSELSAMLKNPDLSQIPQDPGRKPLHRLNHKEYENSVRDLFGVDFQAAQRFPSDGSGGGGFDNNAATLFVPPLLLEKYLAAAEEIAGKIPSEKLLLRNGDGLTRATNSTQTILKSFARRAFRRPVADEEISGFLQIYQKAVLTGASHEEGIRTALRGILVSPYFLFRIEADPVGEQPQPISDYELATRLSYFLWSSMPDEELMSLAAKNRLHQPAVLNKQVRRMLNDRKATAFSESFVGQWLHTRDLHTSAKPDPRKFPEYSEQTREWIYREPIELFHYLITENESLLDLLNANYTFLNEGLAKIYGVEKVKGEKFQRVSLTDTNRGGVLTMPAVLTLTSYPLRTSPVLRGKWILEEILGTPPPPPPPLVTALSPDDSVKNGLTLRQRLEKHRQEPNCAGCHQKMDPLGFALENFDPIGRWRTEVGGEKVDAAGEMSNGEKIAGAGDLKRALLQRKELFLRNLTERMLAYALGRGLEYYDIPTVKKISDSVVKKNYSSQTLILEIVQSYPFQYRRAESEEQDTK